MSIFFLSVFSSPRLMRLATACFLGLSLDGGPALAQDKVDANSAPNEFVQTVADNALNALKKDQAVQSGYIDSFNKIGNESLLHYVNFQKINRSGRASFRERVNQYDYISRFAGLLKKK